MNRLLSLFQLLSPCPLLAKSINSQSERVLRALSALDADIAGEFLS